MDFPQEIPIKIMPSVDFSTTFPQVVENSVEKMKFYTDEEFIFCENFRKFLFVK